jgi:uncharacterized Tic20 family protein
MPSKDEQNWAIGMHLSLLSGYLIPGAGFVVPVILWFIKRDSSDYLDREGRKAINFMLSLLIFGLISWALCLILIGFVMLWVLGIFGVVTVILAAVKTANGEDFRYPLSLKFLK